MKAGGTGSRSGSDRPLVVREGQIVPPAVAGEIAVGALMEALYAGNWA